MEFFVMVLIFISCMIVLALLIYYFQEYRKPKFSFTDNQKDISAIVLAIAAPGVVPVKPDNSGYPPGYRPILQSPPKSCRANRTKLSESPSPPCNRHPVIPKEYLQMALSLQDFSDSSSSSEQIFYPRKSTAYSVAKKISVVNAEKLERKISREMTPTLQMASYLMARRLSDTTAPISNEELAKQKRSHFSRTHSLPQRPNPLFQNSDGSFRRKAMVKPSPLISTLVTAEVPRHSNSSLPGVHEATTSSTSEESSSSGERDKPCPPKRMKKLRSMESEGNGSKARGARLVKSQSVDIPDDEADQQNFKPNNLVAQVKSSERLGASLERIRRSPTPLHTLEEED